MASREETSDSDREICDLSLVHAINKRKFIDVHDGKAVKLPAYPGTKPTEDSLNESVPSKRLATAWSVCDVGIKK